MRRRTGGRRHLATLAMMLLQVFGMAAPLWAAAVPAAPFAAGSPFADVTICAAHPGSTEPASHRQDAPTDHRDHLCPHCQLCCGHPLAVTVTPAALSLPGGLQRLTRAFVPTTAPHGPPQTFLYARAPPTPA